MSANVHALHHVRPGLGRGYSRRRRGGGFVYLDAAGRRVVDEGDLARIRSLAIPPAWRDVWIAADPRAHVQAVGYDARGRRQYRYHPAWSAARNAEKFARLAEFCEALPAIRRAVGRDMRCPCPCRDAAVAAAIALMERGHLRVGNEAYTRANGSYGLTTLERRHVRVRGASIRLAYRGKSGVRRRLALEHGDLARALRRFLALPGTRVFKFRVEGGRVRRVRPEHVNEYLHRVAGPGLTAKYFRTWAATLCCMARLAAGAPPESDAAARRAVREAIRETAERLGHTPAVCRQSYVHPAVIDAYLRGDLAAHAGAAARGPRWRFGGAWQRRAERALAALLTGASRP